jgi:hypothetical protein
LRSARSWHRDPVEKLLPEWSGSTLLRARLRNKLEDALQIVEDETCQECGQPIWICHSTLGHITFSVKNSICYAEEPLHKAREALSKTKSVGKHPYVVADFGDEGRPTRQEGLASLPGAKTGGGS